MASAPLAATLCALLLQGGAFLLRRRPATTRLVIVATVPILLALLFPNSLFTITALPVLIASFLAGLATPFRALRGPAVIGAVLVAIGQFVDMARGAHTGWLPLAFAAAGQAIVVVGAPLLAALPIAAQRAARDARTAALEALRRERDAQIGEAIALERAAMARELHDIAAHHLSAIALMSSAIERQITTDPGAAESGIRHVRAQSRAVLDDLRRLVGLLRDTDGGAQVVKTVATIPALLDAARAAGTDVKLRVLENPRWELADGIGPLGQLAAYRMVQESLTNVARHAPAAPCTVTLDDREPECLRIAVRNAAPAGPAAAASGESAGGFGIVGMRERAALVDGFFDAGPTPDGGWEARMTVPRAAAPRDESDTTP